MKNLNLSFYEVEHAEDLRVILEDLKEAGAKNVNSFSDYEEEQTAVSFEVEDLNTFIGAFSATDSSDFCDNLPEGYDESGEFEAAAARAEENTLPEFDWANSMTTDVEACNIDDSECEACGS